MNQQWNRGPSKAEEKRTLARNYRAKADQAVKAGLKLVPFGAVDTTPEQLRKWADGLEREANELDRKADILKKGHRRMRS